MPLALAPFVIVPIGLHVAVSRAGEALARKAGALVARVDAERRPPSSTLSPEASVDDEEPPPAPSPPVAGPVACAKRAAPRIAPAPGVSVTSSSAPARARVVIAADRALQLAPRLRSVRAATARDDRGRPVGAGLSGVSALGVGLEDGDVVTDIAGRPTPTADEALAVALAIYASGARVVRGTIMRRGAPVDVTVNVPAVR